MNILQVVNVRWWNASAYYAILQAIGLQKRGHRVVIAGKKNSLPLQKAREAGLEIYDEINLESTKPSIIFQIVRKFPSVLRKYQIDLLNPHRGENFPVMAWMAKRMGIPVVRTRGDVRPPRKNLFSRYQNIKLTDFHIVSLKKMVQHYLDLGIPENKIQVLYGAVHPEFEEWRIQKSFENKALTFGMLARLTPIKGHRIALEALKIVTEKYPETMLIIGGKEEQLSYEDIKKIIRELDLEKNVKLLGFVDSIWDFLTQIDVGVSASYQSEVICRICFEMMSQGIPMIVSRWNVLEEIVEDGKNGLIFEPKDAKDLAKKMIRMIENRDALKQMSQQARRIMQEKYFLEPFIDQVESIFERIIHE
jgi:glycosyltransferase involved in cell wall biosynthesis